MLKMCSISLTDPHSNLDRLIDEPIKTEIPLEIGCNEHILKIGLEQAPSKMSRLIARPETIIDPQDDLIKTDWLKLDASYYDF